MIRLVHVISDLDAGGAEVMLAKLVGAMDRSRFENVVVSLTDRGDVGGAIEAAGIPVLGLGMRRGGAALGALPRLIGMLRASRPALVQSWLYHADLAALLATRLAGRPPIVWNVRCSDMDLRRYARRTRFIVAALARCSRVPAAVVVNSRSGQAQHERLGYRPRRWVLIPNGFDLERFRPEPTAGPKLRGELGLPDDAVVIALVARVDPMKDHEGFLAAARRVTAARASARFVLVGRGTEALAPRIDALGLRETVLTLGYRDDTDRLLPGADVACLSSTWGEGFPNVLGEAMACGVPCVTTDVGDAGAIVGDTGLVVPPGDPDALARALTALIDRGPAARAALGGAARARVAARYALPAIVLQYQALYTSLL
jgi:glycosyltransferase involved in cell wall biosynthesis